MHLNDTKARKLISSSIHYTLRQCTIEVMGRLGAFTHGTDIKHTHRKNRKPQITLSSEGMRSRQRHRTLGTIWKVNCGIFFAHFGMQCSGRVFGIKISLDPLWWVTLLKIQLHFQQHNSWNGTEHRAGLSDPRIWTLLVGSASHFLKL